MIKNTAISFAAFFAITLLALALGADNLGIAATFGQIAFAVAAVSTILVRA